MKTGLKFYVFAAAPLALVHFSTAGLSADSVYYNSSGRYTVTVSETSSAFNTSAGFNGAKASFGGAFGAAGSEGSGQVTVNGTFTATFQADAGYVFSGLSMNFDLWSYSNAPAFGGHGSYGNWTVPGSTYVGSIDPAEGSPSSMSWTGSGSGGSWSYYRYVWGEGGGGEFQSLMGPSNSFPIQLNDAASFTVVFNVSFFAVNNSSYGTSSLGLHPELVSAPIPEPSSFAALLGAASLAMASGRRRRRSAAVQNSL